VWFFWMEDKNTLFVFSLPGRATTLPIVLYGTALRTVFFTTTFILLSICTIKIYLPTYHDRWPIITLVPDMHTTG